MQLQLGGEQNRHAHRVGRQCLRQCVYHGYRHYDDADTTPTTTVVKTETVDAGAELARSGHIDWNGKNGATPPSPLYGDYYAQIMLQVNSDEDPEWEDEDRSDTFHRITVDAYPVPDAGDDETVDLNPTTNSAEVTFNGSRSYDPDGNTIQTYTWDFGDDSTPVTVATNPTSHAYTAAGSYTVSFTVTDDEGESASYSITVSVKAPPVADAGSDKEVELDSTTDSVRVTFDGSGSYDPDGGALTYAWDFGDGSPAGSGAEPSHTYTAKGSYTVTLTVTDDERVEASDTLTVTVAEILTAGLTLTGPDDVTRGDTATYTASITPEGLTLDTTPTFKWKYTSIVFRSNRDSVTITENISATSENSQSAAWSGAMVVGVTLEVRTTVNDTEYTQTLDVTVNNREWVTEVPITTDTTSRGVEAPQSHSDLGDVEYEVLFTLADDLETAKVSSGPNKGILYITALNLTAPFTVKINRHFGVAEADFPPTWVAFKNANPRYGEIEAKVKARLGFDGSTSRTLYGSWEDEIHYSDPEAQLEKFMEVPHGLLSDYESQIMIYVEYIQSSRKAAMDRAKSGWSPSGININYDYLVVADAGMDQTVSVDSAVNFDGSMSFVPASRTVTDYVWDFGDMTDYDWDPQDGAILASLPASHTYTAPGVKTVTLTVTDDEGDTHSDTMTVTVFQGTIDRANSDGLLANPVSSTPLTNPPMASIVYNVQPATDFTPTSVAIEIHDSEDIEDTLVKQFNLTASNDNSYTISWDGTNNAGVDVPVGHYDVRGIVTYTAGALSYSHTSKYHRVVVTRFQGVIDADNTDSRLLFLEDPPSESASGTGGASGASGARGTRSAPRATTQTTPTVTATAPRARITYNVLAGAGFTHSDVYVKIFSGDTEIKRIDGLTDSGGNVFTSSWDGTNSQGNRVSEGDYIVKGYVNYVNITGSTYEHESSPHTITVGTDFYPVASATVVTAEANLVVGETIQFDASASRDPDDDGLGTPNNGISAFHWDFGEGADPQTADTAQASCTYSSEGEKIVTLTVIDNDGDPALNDGQGQPGNLAENPRAVTESVSVTVGQAVAILTRDPDNPDDITTNVAIVDTEYYSQIADADNTNTLVNKTRKAKIWYEISEARYADFPRREITLEIGNDKNSDNDPILTFYLTPYNLGVRSTEWDGRFVAAPPENAPTHPYGLFYAHIRLKINRDSDAAWEFNYVSDPHDITVDAWPIANAGGDQTVYVGDAVTFDGSGSYDPDGNAIQTYTWDFDDDTTPVTVATNPTSHAYTAAGSYTVSLTVTDDEGHTTPTERADTVAVTVNPNIEVVIDAANSDSYLVANQDTTSAEITYEVNPSIWKEIEPTTENSDISSPVSLTITKDGETDPVVSVPLDLPTEAAQTYSWDGKKPATTASDGTVTPAMFVPGVYQVKISVVRDPNAATPEEPVATATHQITVFKVDVTSVTLPNVTPGTTDGVSFTASTASTTTPTGENTIVCVADIKPDALDASHNAQIEWEIQDNPDVTGDSGDPDDAETGTNVTLPAVALAAPAGRNFRLNYRIQASLEITEGTKTYKADSEWKLIQQDERDYLRQQYMDINTGSIQPPARSALIDTLPGNIFSFDDFSCNGGTYCNNHTFEWDDTVSAGFLKVRKKYHEAYSAGISVTSAYRCPRYNKKPSVGGATTSRHIQGDAFDFDNGTNLANWNVARKAEDAMIPRTSILLYRQSDKKATGPKSQNLQWLIDRGCNAETLPQPNPGETWTAWTEYNYGHISTEWDANN